MIDFLQGIVFSVEEDSVVIQVNGMGYQVFVPQPESYKDKMEDTCFVYTHHYMREDWMGLFGFQTKEERDLFRLFLSVSGIGPKVALSMMAQVEPNQVIQAIIREDDKTLMKMPGVGKKTAQRMILDLKDKVKDFSLADKTFDKIEDNKSQRITDEKGSQLQEALKSLGYHEQEVQKAIYQLTDSIGKGEPLEGLIKKALHILMKE